MKTKNRGHLNSKFMRCVTLNGGPKGSHVGQESSYRLRFW